MNFFEHQARARRQSLLLIVLFLLAGALLVCAVTIVIAYSYLYFTASFTHQATGALKQLGAGFFISVALTTLTIIIGASLWKLSLLSKGGHVVAEMLGGERVDPGSHDPAKLRLTNVVEEMAIASGTPVPAIYLIEAEGINAFAAGFSPGQAVIGVTRGCMELLSRDELQGVIAHEFSHILNGDMRLNMRLIGVLHGILVIGLLGQALMRGTFKRSRYRYRYLDSDPARRRSTGGTVQTILLGLALRILGSVGLFLGRLIKAALSRQREFLADASAVQFTRNADGMVNALRKIRVHDRAARIIAPNTEQVSHLFFGEAVSSGFTDLLSTHPPIAVRIKRIRPRFAIDRDPVPRTGIETLENAGLIPRFSGFEIAGMAPASTLVEGSSNLTPDLVVAAVGTPQPEHLEQAKKAHEAIPNDLIELAHQSYGARGLLIALLLDKNKALRASQLRVVSDGASDRFVNLVKECATQSDTLPTELRLPLLGMTLPAVAMLEEAKINQHLQLMRNVVTACQPMILAQYVVFAIARTQLTNERGRPRHVYHRRLKPLSVDVAVVVGLLARVGHTDEATARLAFTVAMAEAGVTTSELPPIEMATVSALEKSLKKLGGLALMPRMKLVSALATAVLYDQDVRIGELELLRAICEILDCPLPPLQASV